MDGTDSDSTVSSHSTASAGVPARQGGFNNCHVAGSMSDKQWDDAMDRFYDSFPMTKERAQWYDLFHPSGGNKKAASPLRKKKPLSSKKTAQSKTKKTIPAKKNKAIQQPKKSNPFAEKKNKQGFPMKFCKFQPEVGEFVYIPPSYGGKAAEKDLTIRWCRHCKLSPCVTVEYYTEMCKKGSDMENYDEVEPADIRVAISEELQKRHCKLFQKRYTKRTKPVECVTKFVEWWWPDYGVYEYGCSDKLEAQYFPELYTDPMLNYQIGDGPSP